MRTIWTQNLEKLCVMLSSNDILHRAQEKIGDPPHPPPPPLRGILLLLEEDPACEGEFTISV